MTLNRKIRIIAIVLLLTASHRSDAQDYTPQEIQEAFIKAATNYEISRRDSDTPFQLRRKPVLNWTNPERSDQLGYVFIWQEAGLPMAIGSFFTFEYRGLRAKYEFHSLADRPVTASVDGQIAWSPTTAGVTWHEVADLGVPSKSKNLRLTQMRRLASSFDVRLIKPDGDRRKLRLLRTPLVRFESPAKSVSDGAMFSYAVATDPEAILIVRVRDDGWEFAFARFHYWALEAKRAGELVWKVELDMTMENNHLGDAEGMTKVYNSFYPEADSLFRP